MLFTVYTMGDTMAFWSTLNAVAMFFSQKGFIYSAGLAASMITLVMVIMSMVAKTGNDNSGQNPFLAFVYLGLTFIFTSINTNVQVEDIYTGNVTQVNNIPIIVAAPASLISTASYTIFTTIDTAYQSTGGSYMSVSSNGMKTPLQLLYSMREGWSEQNNVSATNYRLILANCSPNSPNFASGLKNTTDILSYLSANMNQIGMTLYYPTNAADLSSVTPTYENCGDAVKAYVASVNALYASSLAASSSPSSTSNDFNTVISQNMALNKILGPKKFTLADVQNTLTNVTSSTSAQTAISNSGTWVQNTLMTQILYDATVQGLECMNYNLPSLASSCWSRVSAERTAKEQWKADAAGGGSLFASLMGSIVTFMQIMFFAFSPIILIFALFLGAGSIKLVGKYLMFCVWSVSWWPFAAVIQNYIQVQVADQITYLATYGGGINVATMGNYYDIISSNLGIASNMLAAVPILSMALLTGSHQAMTSLATSMGGGDHFDEKNAVGSGQQVGAIASQAPMDTGNKYGSGDTGAKDVEFSSQGGLDNSLSSSRGTALETSKASTDAMANVNSRLHSVAGSTSDMTTWGKDFGETFEASQAASKEVSQSLVDKSGISQDQAREVTAMAGAGVPMTDIKAALKLTDKQSASVSQELTHGLAEKATKAYALKNAAGAKFNQAVASGMVTSDAASNATQHTLSDIISSARKASENYQSGEAMKSTLGGAISMPMGQMASNLGSHLDSSAAKAGMQEYLHLKNTPSNGLSESEQKTKAFLERNEAVQRNANMRYTSSDGVNLANLASAKMSSGDFAGAQEILSPVLGSGLRDVQQDSGREVTSVASDGAPSGYSSPQSHSMGDREIASVVADGNAAHVNGQNGSSAAKSVVPQATSMIPEAPMKPYSEAAMELMGKNAIGSGQQNAISNNQNNAAGSMGSSYVVNQDGSTSARAVAPASGGVLPVPK